MSYGVSADQLFLLLVKTICTIGNWKVVGADESKRIIQISTVNPDDRDGCRQAAEITLIISYDADSISTLQLILQTKEPIEQEAAVENYPIKKIMDLTGSGLTLKDIEYVPGDYSSVTRVLLPKRAERRQIPAKKSRRKKHAASSVADKAALINKLLRELGVLTSDGKS